MKLALTLNCCCGISWRSFVLFCLLIILSAQARSESYPKPLSDTILIQKQQVSRKHGIRLYPDATHHVLFFGAKGIYGRAYQLFIFDVEGKLVKQVNIKNKQTTVLENIQKGDYLFEVFSDDERIENGQVIVR
ncbi:T9SS type A sorting domain-containing protein [Flavitalea sp.]|nr:T9SS type A sorting domain-containing protein [Flavitalea sp.]